MTKKDLFDPQALDKLKKLAGDIDFAMMATQLETPPFHIVPMSTKEVDSDGNIWFLSSRDSTHNRNIEADHQVQLVYSHPSNMQFLTVYGSASIVTDHARLKQLYGKSDDMWFSGVDDPKLSAIRVEPSDCFYWDTKTNSLITLLKMGSAYITGQQPDVMDQGKLNV